MKIKRIPIISDLAHFHIPYSSKQQRTYMIPPPSTIIGIQKILFGHDIDNFVFGYTLEHSGIFVDLIKTYKETNQLVKNTEYLKNGIQNSDVRSIEYLINPKIYLYTTIDKELQINDILNLGKTDCLARVLISQIQEIELKDIQGNGFNQWTDIKTGEGSIKRITTETIYNEEKGYYDIYNALFRENREFNYDKYFDEDREQSIFLWKYNKEGKLNAM